MSAKIACEVGDRFGKLVITKTWSQTFSDPTKKQKVCECHCDCGVTVIVRATSLRHDGKAQCGCEDARGLKTIFKVGDKYGMLTILRVWSEKFPPHRSKEKICECRCDCGNIIVTRGRNLRNGHKQSCGCLHNTCNKNHHAWKGCGELSKSLWNDIIRGSQRRSRRIPFRLTIQQGWNLFLKQERKCAISGAEIRFPNRCKKYGTEDRTASLDRIDSSKNYTLDNVQWVHKVINIMKNELPQEQFVEWCKTITKHQQLTK
jgi:hypothetical protein